MGETPRDASSDTLSKGSTAPWHWYLTLKRENQMSLHDLLTRLQITLNVFTTDLVLLIR